MDSSSLLRPAVIVPIVAVAVIILGAISGFATLARGKRRAAALRRWTHAAYSLWTGGEDCGTWAKDRATASLASWYGATGPGHLWKVIAELRDGQTGNPAWDQVRALDLLRIGRAADYLDDDACWTEAGKIAVALQRRYRGWDDLASQFEAGMLAWHHRRNVTDPNELGRVQRHLPALKQSVWPTIDFDAKLVED